MKTTGKLLVAFVALATASSPAFAGKKKCKKKKAPVAAEKTRRLSDELGLGITLASTNPDAPKAAPAIVDPTVAVAQAESFDLSRLDGRKSDAPSGDATTIHMEAMTLSQSQVGDVVKGHGGDLEYCWSRVPAEKREASSFTLHLMIDARGAVTGLSLGGDAPAKLTSCLTTAAKRWQFPLADTTSEVDYPVSFN